MPNWIVDDRLTTTLDGVLETHVHVEAGEGSITAGDCPSWIDVERRSGEAPIVTVEDGVLEVRYERPWRGWSRRGNRALVSMAVPATTDVVVTSGSAPVVVAGLVGQTSVRTASGDVVLDRAGGNVRV